MTNVARTVALTFDAEPEGHGAAEILDILREADLRVTLLTGQFIREHPDLVQRDDYSPPASFSPRSS